MSTKRFQSGPSKPAALRARPKHPVVDADGHTAEFEPGVLDYLKDIAGSKAVERNKAASDGAFFFPWNRMTDQESARLAGVSASGVEARVVRNLCWSKA